MPPPVRAGETLGSVAPAAPIIEHDEPHFRSIVDNPGFRKAPAVRNLLLYLWKHRREPISEYTIATEALSRRPDFNPKIDAAVRIHIGCLRQMLKEHCSNDGRGCPLRLSIPLSGHQLEIQWNDISDPLPDPAVVPAGAQNLKVWMLVGVCVALALCCLVLFVQNRRVTATLQGKSAPTSLPRFWSGFFANGKPTKFVTPTRSSWNGRTRASKGPPRLLQNYTVASDTFAALKLAQYFQANAIHASFGGTAELSLDSLTDHNIILLGIAGTSRHIQQLMEKSNFYSLPGQARAVFNRSARPGEAASYEESLQSDQRRTSPGLIALLPGRSNGTHLLIITGRYTSSLVSFLISPGSLDLLDQAWRQGGSPDFFEAVVQADIEGGNVLQAWPVAFRAGSGSFWWTYVTAP